MGFASEFNSLMGLTSLYIGLQLSHSIWTPLQPHLTGKQSEHVSCIKLPQEGLIPKFPNWISLSFPAHKCFDLWTSLAFCLFPVLRILKYSVRPDLDESLCNIPQSCEIVIWHYALQTVLKLAFALRDSVHIQLILRVRFYETLN